MDDVPLGGSESTGGGMPDNPPPSLDFPPAQNEGNQKPVEPRPKKPDQSMAAGGGSASDEVIKHIQTWGERQAKEHSEFVDQAGGIFRSIQEMLKQPLPAMPQVPGTMMPPDRIEQQRQLGHSILGYMAIALPLAIAMGSRGGWAMTGALGGLGRGLSEVVAGNQAQADRAFNQGLELQGMAHERFKDQIEAYKEVLSNRNYTIGQMTDVIGGMAKIYGDKQVFDASQQNMWVSMLDYISKREQQERAYALKVLEIKTRIQAVLGRREPAEQQDYDKIIRQRSQQNRTSIEEEEKKYPFQEFYHEYSQEKKGAAPIPGQAPTGFQQQSEHTDPELESAIMDIIGGAVREDSTAPGGSSE